MKTRYRLFKRGSIFYSEDAETGKQESLKTRVRADALRLLAANNEAHLQPQFCLHLARVYMLKSDPARRGRYLTSSVSPATRALRQEIVRLSQNHPRYGYRRITALLRRGGHEVNAKRVQRVRRVQGLQVSKKQRRMRRVGESTAQRQRATHRGHVWSWDFVEDQTERGSRFRVLTLIDEFTRECLAVHIAWSIRAVDVITVVEAAMERFGVPEHLRSDNGPEFIAYAVQDWLKEKGVKTIYIEPGSPWENAYIESFHDKLRDECLNRELFGSLLEAQVIIEQWRLECNGLRPHSSLGYWTPHEFCGGARLRDCGRATPSLRHEEPTETTTSNPWQDSSSEVSSEWGQVRVYASFYAAENILKARGAYQRAEHSPHWWCCTSRIAAHRCPVATTRCAFTSGRKGKS